MVVGGAVLNKEAGNIAKEAVVDILNDPDKTNTFLKAANEVFLYRARENAKEYGINLTPNPERASMLDIIRTGVELYGKPVYSIYDKESIANSEKASNDLLTEIGNLDTSNITGDALLNFLVNPQSDDYRVVGFLNVDALSELNHSTSGSPEMRYASQGIISYREVPDYYPNSGIVKRALSQSTNTEEVSKLIRDEIITPFEAIRQVSERRSARLSTAHLFSHYLERGKGNLREAQIDTDIALKVMARSDLETGAYIADQDDKLQEVCSRFSCLLDQYSLLGRNFGAESAKLINSYDSSNKDLSEINQIGTYHPWAITDKLFSDSQKVIKTTIIGTMLTLSYLDQGNLKAAVDFNTLLELSKIDSYFKSFSR